MYLFWHNIFQQKDLFSAHTKIAFLHKNKRLEHKKQVKSTKETITSSSLSWTQILDIHTWTTSNSTQLLNQKIHSHK